MGVNSRWSSFRPRNLLPPFFGNTTSASSPGAPAEPTLDFGEDGLSTDQIKESTNGAGVLIDLLLKIRDGALDLSATGYASGAAKIIMKGGLASGFKFTEASGPDFMTFRTATGGSGRSIAANQRLILDLNGAGFTQIVGGVRSVNVTPSSAQTGAVVTPTVFDNAFQFQANELNAIGTFVEFQQGFVHTVQAGGGFVMGVSLGGVSLMPSAGADITPNANDRTTVRGWFVVKSTGASAVCWGEATLEHTPSGGGTIGASRKLVTGTGATLDSAAIDLTAAAAFGVFIDRANASNATNSTFSPYLIVRTTRIA